MNFSSMHWFTKLSKWPAIMSWMSETFRGALRQPWKPDIDVSFWTLGLTREEHAIIVGIFKSWRHLYLFLSKSLRKMCFSLCSLCTSYSLSLCMDEVWFSSKRYSWKTSLRSASHLFSSYWLSSPEYRPELPTSGLLSMSRASRSNIW